jgi:hypothetical protein
MFPTHENFDLVSLYHQKYLYKLISEPLSNIKHFKHDGEVSYETKISGGSGGGSSIGGAITGGIIAGSVGAVIGSRKKTEEITSERIRHDNRQTVLEVQDGAYYFDYDGYDILLELIPEKEYTFVQELKRQKVMPNANIQLSIPDMIRELAKLRDEGILTDEEFSVKKGELLARL